MNAIQEYTENEAEKLELKGYTYKKRQMPFFYVWINDKKPDHLIRLCRVFKGDWQPPQEYWNLELDYVPFNYKHNHRENANIEGELIKTDDIKKNISEFDSMLDRIKRYVRRKQNERRKN